MLALRLARAAHSRAAVQGLLARAQKMGVSSEHSAFLAMMMDELGRSDDALAILDEALTRAPRSARLYNDKAILEARLGRLREAEKDLEKAISTDADMGSAYLSLGAVRSSLGEPARAEQAYTAGLSRSRVRSDAPLRSLLQNALRRLAQGRPGSVL